MASVSPRPYPPRAGADAGAGVGADAGAGAGAVLVLVQNPFYGKILWKNKQEEKNVQRAHVVAILSYKTKAAHRPRHTTHAGTHFKDMTAPVMMRRVSSAVPSSAVVAISFKRNQGVDPRFSFAKWRPVGKSLYIYFEIVLYIIDGDPMGALYYRWGPDGEQK